MVKAVKNIKTNGKFSACVSWDPKIDFKVYWTPNYGSTQVDERRIYFVSSSSSAARGTGEERMKFGDRLIWCYKSGEQTAFSLASSKKSTDVSDSTKPKINFME